MTNSFVSMDLGIKKILGLILLESASYGRRSGMIYENKGDSMRWICSQPHSR